MKPGQRKSATLTFQLENSILTPWPKLEHQGQLAPSVNPGYVNVGFGMGFVWLGLVVRLTLWKERPAGVIAQAARSSLILPGRG